jgi:hypothetical protein
MAVTAIRCSGCGASGLQRTGNLLTCSYCGAQIEFAPVGDPTRSACAICASTRALVVCAFCRRFVCDDHATYWSDFHLHACRTCRRGDLCKEFAGLLELESSLAEQSVSLQKEISHLESTAEATVLPWVGGASGFVPPIAGGLAGLLPAFALLILVPIVGIAALLCFPVVGAAAGWFFFRSRILKILEAASRALRQSGDGALSQAREAVLQLREQRGSAIRRRDEILSQVGVAEERRRR